jgi:glycerophosphoryl diester phosphodiesterase
MTHPYFDLPAPLVLGHRGAAGAAPENTLLSFERAIELGAQIIESDVRATADDVPVLLHDGDLERITDGSGRVEDRTLAEVKELDAGYHFSIEDRGDPSWLPGPDDHFRGRGLRIPTLAEAFESFPAARFNLEIKARSPVLIAEVVQLVREFDREALTLLTAGDDAIMEVLREELHRSGVNPAIGASVSDILGVVQSALEAAEPPGNAMALQIPPTFSGQPLVTTELIAHSHKYGIQIHVWTINDEAEMSRLLDLGVDGLVTDFPARAAALTARARGASS